MKLEGGGKVKMFNKIIYGYTLRPIIAEVDVNRNSDMELAKKLIGVTKDAGVLEKWSWGK